MRSTFTTNSSPYSTYGRPNQIPEVVHAQGFTEFGASSWDAHEVGRGSAMPGMPHVAGGMPFPEAGEAGNCCSESSRQQPSFPEGYGPGYHYQSSPTFPIDSSVGGIGAMGIQQPPSFPSSGPISSYMPSYGPTSLANQYGHEEQRYNSGLGGFPSAAPGFPGAPGGGGSGYGDYAPPPHGQPNPSLGFDGGMGGAWSSSIGPPPSFPGSDPYGPPQPQQHWRGSSPGYPEAAPPFPGSGGYGR